MLRHLIIIFVCFNRIEFSRSLKMFRILFYNEELFNYMNIRVKNDKPFFYRDFSSAKFTVVKSWKYIILNFSIINCGRCLMLHLPFMVQLYAFFLKLHFSKLLFTIYLYHIKEILIRIFQNLDIFDFFVA